jgi:hypothetical protein
MIEGLSRYNRAYVATRRMGGNAGQKGGAPEPGRAAEVCVLTSD